MPSVDPSLKGTLGQLAATLRMTRGRASFVRERERAIPIRAGRILAQEGDPQQELIVSLQRPARLRQPEELRFGPIPILRPVRAQRALVAIDVFLQARVELRLGSQRL